MKVSISIVMFLAILVASLTTGLVGFIPTYQTGKQGIDDTVVLLRRTIIDRVDASTQLFFNKPATIIDNAITTGESNGDIVDAMGGNTADQLGVYKYLCKLVDLLGGGFATFEYRGASDAVDPRHRGVFYVCDSDLGAVPQVGRNDPAAGVVAIHLWNMTTQNFVNHPGPKVAGVVAPLDVTQRQEISMANEGLTPEQFFSTNYRWTGVRAGYSTIRMIAQAIFPDRRGNTSLLRLAILPSKLRDILFANLELSPGSRVMVLDATTSRVVGLSWDELPYVRHDNWTNLRLPDSERYTFKNASDVGDPLIRKVTAALGGDNSFFSLPNDYATELFSGKDRTYVNVRRFHNNYGLDVRIVLAMPEDDFLGDTNRQQTYTIIILVCVMVVMLILAVIFSIGLTQPLDKLGQRMHLTATLQDDDENDELSVLSEVSAMQEAYTSMKEELNRVRAYLPPSLLNRQQDPANPFVSVTTSEPSASATNTMMSSASSDDEGPIFAGVDITRLLWNVNEFMAKDVVVLVVSTSFGVELLGEEGRAAMGEFFEDLYRFAERNRGVVESALPHQSVISFGAHAQIHNSASAALRTAKHIVKACNGDAVKVTTIIDRASVYVGPCGCEDHRQNVIVSPEVEALKTLGCDLHSRSHVALAATDRICASVTNSSTAAVPFDCVEWVNEEPVTLYQLCSVSSNHKDSAHGQAVKSAFTAVREGNIEEAITTIGDPASILAGSEEHTNYQVAVFGAAKHLLVIARRLVSIGSATVPHRKRFYGWAASQLTGDEKLPPAAFVPIGAFEKTGGRAGEQLRQLDAIQEIEQKKGVASIFLPFGDESGGELPLNAEDATAHCRHDLEESAMTFMPGRLQEWRRSVNCIGRGAFGSVYRAIHRNGSLAAMKVLPLRSREIPIDDLRRELDIASHQQHANLVGFVDADVTDEEVVVVMELMPGGSLESITKDFGSLPVQVIKRIAIDILRGLAHLHRLGVVHCDIKPQNVLLGVDGNCKLADFGSAMQSGGENITTGDDINISGTPSYMAPEIARGETPTAASDIWSFGIVIHELVMGAAPYNDKQSKAMKRGAVSAIRMLGKLSEKVSDSTALEAPIRPRVVNVEDADALRQFLTACLQLNPEDRPSATALLSMEFLL